MHTHITKVILVILAAGFLLTGCKRQAPVVKVPAGAYFQQHFQDESQFIVETTVADLAEQIYFAKYHKLPPAGVFSVAANETADSQFGAPTYDLAVDLDDKHMGLKLKLNVSGPIWSAETYAPVAALLADAVKLPIGDANTDTDTDLLGKLTDGEAATIENENQRLSGALQEDFTNPTLHEEAAILLGAFMLREHSGAFFDIRTPLCRMASHLAFARHQEGDDLPSVNGRMAEALLSTLMNNEADALNTLGGIKTNNAALVSWVRALQARNTADYRPLDQTDGLSPIECGEWFYALERSANATIAWSKLSEVQKKNVTFVRTAHETDYSVETGHELLAVAASLEFEEIGEVYKLVHGKKMGKDDLVPALNEVPEHCVSAGTKQPQVRVISWGLWAGFLQRQLCLAVARDFDFLQRRWGVPDEAAKYSTQVNTALEGLRLYPFVLRFNAIDTATYHRSVDEGFKVTVATPQWVSPLCWNYLCYNLSSQESYRPNPNPHVNEWHKHNPPPGTVYNLYPRLNHPSLVDRGDTDAWLDKLHARAPFDDELNYEMIHRRYKDEPNYAQVSGIFGTATAYNVAAMRWLAYAKKSDPAEYEYLMKQVAATDPSDYFTLAEFFVNLKQDDKAAEYYEKANQTCPDSIMIANNAGWLIKYYLKKGRTADARKLADYGGEVYSFSGLENKAWFLEQTKDYQGAYEWYAKIQERYDSYGPLISFCIRYKAATGDTRYDDTIAQQTKTVFPKGVESVTLASFSGAPDDGCAIMNSNDLLTRANMKSGDVIVAINGVRVHSQAQYEYQRDLDTRSEMVLIVWQGTDYHEYHVNPPGHRFGVDIADYRRK